jgi:NAD(P)-dependent dehydrogenase (short-subunit alcohol dehydrogenase family)
MSRLALVTGGGGTLGAACAVRLARQAGWHVVLADRDQGAAEAVAAAVRREAPSTVSVETAALDVTSRTDWQRLHDRLRGRGVAFHLLVNGAGICTAAEVGEGSDEEWRQAMDVNFFGTLWGCRTFAEWLRASAAEKPRVVNVASIAGLLGPPAMGAYGASKAAVIALSESFAAEMRPHGVRVCVVAPGFFPSGLLAGGRFAQEVHRSEAERLTAASSLTADEVAAAALAGRGGLYVVLGRRARWLWRWKRWGPETFHRVLAARYRGLLRRGE